ncbi:hypothetical protein SAMN05216325_11749 [Nitrosomonas marina]|uniref:Uncharacterized protein n=1 Tax=Nitrosomonas marina TaxID=917 RepID=A0A1H8GCU8_9PROT|nr:hypothetical protein SAMN05216325_11749 [Nitrosomonas marina]
MANNHFFINCVLLIFLCALVSNSLAWAFQGEIFMHVLDNDHQHLYPVAQKTHTTSLPQDLSAETDLTVSSGVCLSTAQQPFFLSKPLHSLLPAITEIFDEFISELISDTPAYSLFRPPRIFDRN